MPLQVPDRSIQAYENTGLQARERRKPAVGFTVWRLDADLNVSWNVDHTLQSRQDSSLALVRQIIHIDWHNGRLLVAGGPMDVGLANGQCIAELDPGNGAAVAKDFGWDETVAIWGTWCQLADMDVGGVGDQVVGCFAGNKRADAIVARQEGRLQRTEASTSELNFLDWPDDATQESSRLVTCMAPEQADRIAVLDKIYACGENIGASPPEIGDKDGLFPNPVDTNVVAVEIDDTGGVGGSFPDGTWDYQWAYHTGPSASRLSPMDGDVYVVGARNSDRRAGGASDPPNVKTEQASVFAIDSSGLTKWLFDAGESPDNVLASAWSGDARVYVLSGGIAVLDPVDGTLLDTWLPGSTLFGIATDGTHLYVCGNQSNTWPGNNGENRNVWKLDSSLNVVESAWLIGGLPLTIVADGTDVFIGSRTFIA